MDGEKCSTCKSTYFGFPSCQGLFKSNLLGRSFLKVILFSECNWLVFNQSFPFLECQCNRDGSTTMECDTNGDCSCKDGYIGQKCDAFGKIF